MPASAFNRAEIGNILDRLFHTRKQLKWQCPLLPAVWRNILARAHFVRWQL
jgi:hypothetical protein